MQAGAAIARGSVLWFLHADSCIPVGADNLILDTLQRTEAGWGRFDISFTDSHPC